MINPLSLNVKKLVESLLPDKEDYIFGFADLTGLLGEKFKGFNYAVVIGKKLDDEIIDSITNGPTFRYYEHYNSINRILFKKAEIVSNELKKMNILNVVIKPTLDDSELDGQYYDSLSADFSHKMAATRAGLGWIGKTALLVSKKFGPRVRFATVLTDLPLENIYPPFENSLCGKCSLCVEVCPAGTASGKLWDISVHRDQFYDPFKCREKARELTFQNFGKEVSLCGICISVCPVGRKNTGSIEQRA